MTKIGQSVLFTEVKTNDDGDSLHPHPAIVTFVADDAVNSVNLIAFVDGQGAFPFSNVPKFTSDAQGGPYWQDESLLDKIEDAVTSDIKKAEGWLDRIFAKKPANAPASAQPAAPAPAPSPAPAPVDPTAPVEQAATDNTATQA